MLNNENASSLHQLLSPLEITRNEKRHLTGQRQSRHVTMNSTMKLAMEMSGTQYLEWTAGDLTRAFSDDVMKQKTN